VPQKEVADQPVENLDTEEAAPEEEPPPAAFDGLHDLFPNQANVPHTFLEAYT